MVKTPHGITFASPESRLPLLIATEKERREQRNAWIEEDIAKLDALCEHFGIAKSEWQYLHLSLLLARQLYPAPKARGRTKKWTSIVAGVLVVEVERRVVKGNRSRGVRWACTQLSKKEPWKSFLDRKKSDLGPDPAEALRQAYLQAKGDVWAEMCRHAYGWHVHENTIGEWEALVEYCVKNPK